MKKIDLLKRSFVGVCAATLLTGLCVAPAFAAGNVTVAGDTPQTASTPVTIDAKDLQVSVTIPTAVPVVLQGETVTLPTNLQIDATGKAAVKVTKIQADALMSGLTLADTQANLTDNNMFFSVQGNPLSATETAPDAAKAIPIGSALALSADFGTLKGSVLSSMMTGTTSSPATLFNLKWTIALDAATV